MKSLMKAYIDIRSCVQQMDAAEYVYSAFAIGGTLVGILLTFGLSCLFWTSFTLTVGIATILTIITRDHRMMIDCYIQRFSPTHHKTSNNDDEVSDTDLRMIIKSVQIILDQQDIVDMNTNALACAYITKHANIHEELEKQLILLIAYKIQMLKKANIEHVKANVEQILNQLDKKTSHFFIRISDMKHLLNQVFN